MSHILLTGTDHVVLQNIQLMLEMAGYAVVRADNGTDVLRSIKAQPPALVVCETRQADMTGLYLLNMLQSDAQTRHLPVVMVLDTRDEPRTRTFLDGGAVGLLIKPFTHDQLMALVTAHVQDQK